MIDERDLPLLQRTLALAAQAGRGTAPNPRVGAVVVDAGRIVGEGWHRRAGEPHAESEALAAAGAAARGATLYTSLEPCAHQGRTPPCTAAIVRAGVARVVVGTLDPDARVAGRGIGALQAAGIAVDVAEDRVAATAARLNEDYFVHRRTGRAFAALKVAATLDGRIADRDGASRWITGAAARSRGKALREQYGAIVVGAGTVLADDPLLLPPSGPGTPPFLRCVMDGRLRTPPAARLLCALPDAAPVVVYTQPGAPVEARLALERAGAEVVPVGPAGGPVPPGEVLTDLARRGVLGALIEGGGATHGAFLDAGCADKLYWFTAPVILGDTVARPAVDGAPRALGAAHAWRIDVEERLCGDILLTLYPASRDQQGPAQ